MNVKEDFENMFCIYKFFSTVVHILEHFYVLQGKPCILYYLPCLINF